MELETTPALLLCPIKGTICLHEQTMANGLGLALKYLGFVFLTIEHRDTDTRRDGDLDIIDRYRFRDRRDQTLRRLCQTIEIADVCQNDGKLGRYKFTRYFSTLEHNRPETLEQLTAVNDLELFDHQSDPEEVVNLAADLDENEELVLAMNTKLNALVDEEVGNDDGSSLGLAADTDYAFTKVDI